MNNPYGIDGLEYTPFVNKNGRDDFDLSFNPGNGRRFNPRGNADVIVPLTDIKSFGQHDGLADSVVDALIDQESNWDATASGPEPDDPTQLDYRAMGLLQMMAKTYYRPGYGVRGGEHTAQTDPDKFGTWEDVQRVGREYFRALLNHHDGNVEHAAHSFHSGEQGTIDWLARGGRLEDARPNAKGYLEKLRINSTKRGLLSQLQDGSFAYSPGTPRDGFNTLLGSATHISDMITGGKTAQDVQPKNQDQQGTDWTDGDSGTHNGKPFRLADTNTPEYGDLYYDDARKFAEMMPGGNVNYTGKQDKYGRDLVTMSGQSSNPFADAWVDYDNLNSTLSGMSITNDASFLEVAGTDQNYMADADESFTSKMLGLAMYVGADQRPRVAPPEDMSTLDKAFYTGGNMVDSAGHKTMAAIQAAFGMKEAAQTSLGEAAALDNDNARHLMYTPTFEEAWNQPTFGGFLEQMTLLGGQAAMQILPMIPELIAGAVTTGGVSWGASIAARTGTRALTYRAVKEMVEEGMKGTILHQADEAAIQKMFELAKRARDSQVMKHAGRGAQAGAITAQYPLSVGGAVDEFQDAGKELDPGNAWASLGIGAPLTALGVAGEFVIAKALMKRALAKSAKEGGGWKKYVQTMAKDLVEGAAGEGVSEAAQQAGYIAQRLAVNPDYHGEGMGLELAQSAIAGFIAGGALSAGGRALASPIELANTLANSKSVKDAVSRAGKQSKKILSGGVDRAKTFVERHRASQSVKPKVEAKPEAQVGGGRTSEPDIDVVAQIGDMFNDNSPRQAVLVTEQQGKDLGFKAGDKGIQSVDINGVKVFGAWSDSRKEFVITKKRIDAANIKSKKFSDEVIANKLGFGSVRPKDGKEVVRVIDEGGRVISEEVVNDSTKEKALEQARSRGEGATVETVSIEQALADREARYNEEQGIDTSQEATETQWAENKIDRRQQAVENIEQVPLDKLSAEDRQEVEQLQAKIAEIDDIVGRTARGRDEAIEAGDNDAVYTIDQHLYDLDQQIAAAQDAILDIKSQYADAETQAAFRGEDITKRDKAKQNIAALEQEIEQLLEAINNENRNPDKDQDKIDAIDEQIKAAREKIKENQKVVDAGTAKEQDTKENKPKGPASKFIDQINRFFGGQEPETKAQKDERKAQTKKTTKGELDKAVEAQVKRILSYVPENKRKEMEPFAREAAKFVQKGLKKNAPKHVKIGALTKLLDLIGIDNKLIQKLVPLLEARDFEYTEKFLKTIMKHMRQLQLRKNNNLEVDEWLDKLRSRVKFSIMGRLAHAKPRGKNKIIDLGDGKTATVGEIEAEIKRIGDVLQTMRTAVDQLDEPITNKEFEAEVLQWAENQLHNIESGAVEVKKEIKEAFEAGVEALRGGKIQTAFSAGDGDNIGANSRENWFDNLLNAYNGGEGEAAYNALNTQPSLQQFIGELARASQELTETSRELRESMKQHEELLAKYTKALGISGTYQGKLVKGTEEWKQYMDQVDEIIHGDGEFDVDEEGNRLPIDETHDAGFAARAKQLEKDTGFPLPPTQVKQMEQTAKEAAEELGNIDQFQEYVNQVWDELYREAKKGVDAVYNETVEGQAAAGQPVSFDDGGAPQEAPKQGNFDFLIIDTGDTVEKMQVLDGKGKVVYEENVSDFTKDDAQKKAQKKYGAGYDIKFTSAGKAKGTPVPYIINNADQESIAKAKFALDWEAQNPGWEEKYMLEQGLKMKEGGYDTDEYNAKKNARIAKEAVIEQAWLVWRDGNIISGNRLRRVPNWEQVQAEDRGQRLKGRPRNRQRQTKFSNQAYKDPQTFARAIASAAARSSTPEARWLKTDFIADIMGMFDRYDVSATDQMLGVLRSELGIYLWVNHRTKVKTKNKKEQAAADKKFKEQKEAKLKKVSNRFNKGPLRLRAMRRIFASLIRDMDNDKSLGRYQGVHELHRLVKKYTDNEDLQTAVAALKTYTKTQDNADYDKQDVDKIEEFKNYIDNEVRNPVAALLAYLHRPTYKFRRRGGVGLSTPHAGSVSRKELRKFFGKRFQKFEVPNKGKWEDKNTDGNELADADAAVSDQTDDETVDTFEDSVDIVNVDTANRRQFVTSFAVLKPDEFFNAKPKVEPEYEETVTERDQAKYDADVAKLEKQIADLEAKMEQATDASIHKLVFKHNELTEKLNSLEPEVTRTVTNAAAVLAESDHTNKTGTPAARLSYISKILEDKNDSGLSLTQKNMFRQIQHMLPIWALKGISDTMDSSTKELPITVEIELGGGVISIYKNEETLIVRNATDKRAVLELREQLLEKLTFAAKGTKHDEVKQGQIYAEVDLDALPGKRNARGKEKGEKTKIVANLSTLVGFGNAINKAEGAQDNIPLNVKPATDVQQVARGLARFIVEALEQDQALKMEVTKERRVTEASRKARDAAIAKQREADPDGKIDWEKVPKLKYEVVDIEPTVIEIDMSRGQTDRYPQLADTYVSREVLFRDLIDAHLDTQSRGESHFVNVEGGDNDDGDARNAFAQKMIERYGDTDTLPNGTEYTYIDLYGHRIEPTFKRPGSDKPVTPSEIADNLGGTDNWEISSTVEDILQEEAREWLIAGMEFNIYDQVKIEHIDDVLDNKAVFVYNGQTVFGNKLGSDVEGLVQINLNTAFAPNRQIKDEFGQLSVPVGLGMMYLDRWAKYNMFKFGSLGSVKPNKTFHDIDRDAVKLEGMDERKAFFERQTATLEAALETKDGAAIADAVFEAKLAELRAKENGNYRHTDKKYSLETLAGFNIAPKQTHKRDRIRDEVDALIEQNKKDKKSLSNATKAANQLIGDFNKKIAQNTVSGEYRSRINRHSALDRIPHANQLKHLDFNEEIEKILDFFALKELDRHIISFVINPRGDLIKSRHTNAGGGPHGDGYQPVIDGEETNAPDTPSLELHAERALDTPDIYEFFSNLTKFQRQRLSKLIKQDISAFMARYEQIIKYRFMDGGDPLFAAEDRLAADPRIEKIDYLKTQIFFIKGLLKNLQSKIRKLKADKQNIRKTGSDMTMLVAREKEAEAQIRAYETQIRAYETEQREERKAKAREKDQARVRQHKMRGGGTIDTYGGFTSMNRSIESALNELYSKNGGLDIGGEVMQFARKNLIEPSQNKRNQTTKNDSRAISIVYMSWYDQEQARKQGDPFGAEDEDGEIHELGEVVSEAIQEVKRKNANGVTTTFTDDYRGGIEHRIIIINDTLIGQDRLPNDKAGALQLLGYPHEHIELYLKNEQDKIADAEPSTLFPDEIDILDARAGLDKVNKIKQDLTEEKLQAAMDAVELRNASADAAVMLTLAHEVGHAILDQEYENLSLHPGVRLKQISKVGDKVTPTFDADTRQSMDKIKAKQDFPKLVAALKQIQNKIRNKDQSLSDDKVDFDNLSPYKIDDLLDFAPDDIDYDDLMPGTGGDTQNFYLALEEALGLSKFDGAYHSSFKYSYVRKRGQGENVSTETVFLSDDDYKKIKQRETLINAWKQDKADLAKEGIIVSQWEGDNGFQEWYADKVAAYSVRGLTNPGRKDAKELDGIFRKILQLLRNAYDAIIKQPAYARFRNNETFNEYIKGVMERVEERRTKLDNIEKQDAEIAKAKHGPDWGNRMVDEDGEVLKVTTADLMPQLRSAVNKFTGEHETWYGYSGTEGLTDEQLHDTLASMYAFKPTDAPGNWKMSKAKPGTYNVYGEKSGEEFIQHKAHKTTKITSTKGSSGALSRQLKQAIVGTGATGERAQELHDLMLQDKIVERFATADDHAAWAFDTLELVKRFPHGHEILEDLFHTLRGDDDLNSDGLLVGDIVDISDQVDGLEDGDKAFGYVIGGYTSSDTTFIIRADDSVFDSDRTDFDGSEQKHYGIGTLFATDNPPSKEEVEKDHELKQQALLQDKNGKIIRYDQHEFTGRGKPKKAPTNDNAGQATKGESKSDLGILRGLPRLQHKGNIDLLLNDDKPKVLVIGTRRATEEGIATTKTIVKGIGEDGIIVSGLAMGIDQAAHEAADPSRSIAIIGSAMDDKPYPNQTAGLRNKMIEGGGLVLTEFGKVTKKLESSEWGKANRQRLVTRDITQAQVADVVVAVEANEGDLEQGRESGTRFAVQTAILAGKPVYVSEEVANETAWGRQAVNYGATVFNKDNLDEIIQKIKDSPPNHGPQRYGPAFQYEQTSAHEKYQAAKAFGAGPIVQADGVKPLAKEVNRLNSELRTARAQLRKIDGDEQDVIRAEQKVSGLEQELQAKQQEIDDLQAKIQDPRAKDTQPIATYGTSNMQMGVFIQGLERNGIEAVIDTRSHPYSNAQRAKHFDKENLQSILEARGISYGWAEALGGHPSDPDMYTNGAVDYRKLAASKEFQDALETLKETAKDKKVAIICSCGAVHQCHRFNLVGRALEAQGYKVEHVIEQGSQDKGIFLQPQTAFGRMPKATTKDKTTSGTQKQEVGQEHWLKSLRDIPKTPITVGDWQVEPLPDEEDHTVFLSGSRILGHRDEANKEEKLLSQAKVAIDEFIAKGKTILIGDADGADQKMQKYLKEKGYKKVIVYAMDNNKKDGNNVDTGKIRARHNEGNWTVRFVRGHYGTRQYEYYQQKDSMMARDATSGYVMWNGKSAGTKLNVLRLLMQKKHVRGLGEGRLTERVSPGELENARNLLVKDYKSRLEEGKGPNSTTDTGGTGDTSVPDPAQTGYIRTLSNNFRQYKNDPEHTAVVARVNDTWGMLTNFYTKFPALEVNGRKFRTSEGLFHALKTTDAKEQETLVDLENPYKEKTAGRAVTQRKDWDNANVKFAAMVWVLKVKLAQNWDAMSKLLEETGDRAIVEAIGKERWEKNGPDVWGALGKTVDGERILEGQNWLGRALMMVRKEMREKTKEEMLYVPPPDIPNATLFGEPIQAIGNKPGGDSDTTTTTDPDPPAEPPFGESDSDTSTTSDDDKYTGEDLREALRKKFDFMLNDFTLTKTGKREYQFSINDGSINENKKLRTQVDAYGKEYFDDYKKTFHANSNKEKLEEAIDKFVSETVSKSDALIAELRKNPDKNPFYNVEPFAYLTRHKNKDSKPAEPKTTPMPKNFIAGPANIFESKAPLLLNPVNAEAVSGAGLAKLFKNKFPIQDTDWQSDVYKNGMKAGEIKRAGQSARAEEGKTVLYAATKDVWQNDSKMEYIEAIADRIAEVANSFGGEVHIAVPPLGTGLGKLDRKAVLEVLKSKLGGIDNLKIELVGWGSLATGTNTSTSTSTNNNKNDKKPTSTDAKKVGLDQLNPEQREAAETTEGPLLVLSGAGTGKTTTVIARLSNILSKGLAKPHEILSTTFTKKAAVEMQERIEKNTGINKSQFRWIGTMDSIAAKIVTENTAAAGVRDGWTIHGVIPEWWETSAIVKKLMDARYISYAEIAPKRLEELFNELKSNGIAPDDIPFGVNEQLAKIASASGLNKSSFPAEFAEMYRDFQEALRDAGKMTYSDIFNASLRALRDENVRNKYKKQFKYLMVDEYQDTNAMQREWLGHLTGDHNNIAVVGDDDQAIYGFRGSKVNIIRSFESEFDNAKVVRLEANYRSTKHIIETAMSVIEASDERIGKKLRVGRTDDGTKDPDKVSVNYFSSAEQDAANTTKTIADKVTAGQKLSDFAILTRVNAALMSFEIQLLGRGIKYKMQGNNVSRFLSQHAIKELLKHPSPDSAQLQKVVVDEAKKYKAKNRPSKSDQKNAWVLSMVTKHIQFVGKDYNKVSRGDEDAMTFGEFKKLVADDTAWGKQSKTDTKTEAVTIGSIHSAKGLEWPEVFLAGVEFGMFPPKSPDPKDDIELLPKNINSFEEETRLLYVAMTRAREKLHISWTKVGHKAKAGGDPDARLGTLNSDNIVLNDIPGVSHAERLEHAKSLLNVFKRSESGGGNKAGDGKPTVRAENVVFKEAWDGYAKRRKAAFQRLKTPQPVKNKLWDYADKFMKSEFDLELETQRESERKYGGSASQLTSHNMALMAKQFVDDVHESAELAKLIKAITEDPDTDPFEDNPKYEDAFNPESIRDEYLDLGDDDTDPDIGGRSGDGETDFLIIDTPENRARAKKVVDTAKSILTSTTSKTALGDGWSWTKRHLFPADNWLRSLGAGGTELAQMFYGKSQSTEGEGFHARKDRLEKVWFERLVGALGEDVKNLNNIDLNEGPIADAFMEAADESIDTKDLKGKARKIREFFERIYDEYITEKTQVGNKIKTKNWIDVERRKNYAPRQLDITKIQNDPIGFIEFLEPHMQGDTVAARHVQAEEVVSGILDSVDDLGIDPLGWPKFSSGKRRVLDKPEISKALIDHGWILTPGSSAAKYIHHVVKRVEYAKMEMEEKLPDLIEQILDESGKTGEERIELGNHVYQAIQAQFGRVIRLGNKPYSDKIAYDEKVNELKESDAYKHATRDERYEMIGNIPYIQSGKSIIDSPGMRAVNSIGTTHTIFTTLSFATLASLPDAGGITARAKEFGRLKDVIRNIADKESREEAQALYRSVGMHTHDALNNMFMSASEVDHTFELSQAANRAFFKVTGTELYTNSMRTLAVGVGKDFLLYNAYHPRIDKSIKRKRWLKELDITKEEIIKWNEAGRPQEGELFDKRIAPAIARFANESIIRPNAAQRPIWSSNPWFTLLWNLKSYFYSYGKTVMGGMYREAKNRHTEVGTLTAPATVLLLGAGLMLPLTALGLTLREHIKWAGRTAIPGLDGADAVFHSQNMGFLEYVKEIVDRSGVLGPYTLMLSTYEGLEREGVPMGAAIANIPALDAIDDTIFDGDATRMLPVINNL